MSWAIKGTPNTFVGTSSMVGGLIVKPGSTALTVAQCTAGDKDIIGVVAKKADADGTVTVYSTPGDICLVKLGGTVTQGTKVISDANGAAVAAAALTTTIASWKGCLGLALIGGVSGDYVPVRLSLIDIAQ